MVAKSIVREEVCEYFLIITPTMKENYEKYGEAVNIDFNLASIKRGANLRTYNVGIFSGQNNLERTVLFGIGIINGTMEIRYHSLM